MVDLSTTYMGINLKNPIIAGSCGKTASISDIREIEARGAAAIVLKSLFEEQILEEVDSYSTEKAAHPEAADYMTYYVKENTVGDYLDLIQNAKKAVSIPVIASINCVTGKEWVQFAAKVEAAGADGLEINVFVMPSDSGQEGRDIEAIYFDIVDNIKKYIKIPFSLKISYYFSGLANTIVKLSQTGINGLVLFNRFWSPDIDVDNIEVVSSHVFSKPEEITLPLRWIGMLSGEVNCDLVASTGIHDGRDVVKTLLAGAKAAAIATTLYENGIPHIEVMLAQIEQWMKTHHFRSINDFRGRLSQKSTQGALMYERAQFMRYFSSHSA
jgi:dihydroorotate dehydrogenase (fumarate)